MNRIVLTKRVNQAGAELLAEKGYIAPVDLFKKIGMLTETDYEGWRRRQVPYLEKVLRGSLGRCSLVMSKLRSFAYRNRLKPSQTAYMSWGRGAKTRLVFSKYRNENVEKWYSIHFVKPKMNHAEGVRVNEEKLQAQAKRRIDKERGPYMLLAVKCGQFFLSDYHRIFLETME